MHNISLSLVLLAFISCTPKISTPTKPVPSFWLKTSLYSFQFYDHLAYCLLDQRPNFAINDLKTLDGYTINPKKHDLIIPAGTLVQVLDISYPDFSAKFSRPLYSPKNQVWVYLKVGRERGQVTVFHDKIHIMILPKNVQKEEEVEKTLAQFLSNIDPNPWLISQSNYIKEGIFLKEPKIGMEKKHVLSALGEPLAKSSMKDPDLNYTEELWEYPHYLLVFNMERLNKIKKIGPAYTKDKN